MAENGVKSLEETLETPETPETPSEQHGIVEKLYAELDLEREASATAASEALSMMLRLQEEKAAEQMEAHQYKRMVEEKIHHNEELLATLEELLYQKDMEIASLRSQLKIYGDQVLNSGISTPSFSEIDALKTPFLRRNDTLNGDMNLHETMSNDFALPTISFTGIRCEMDVLDEGMGAPQKQNSDAEHFYQFTDAMNNQQGPNNLCKLLSGLSVQSPALICNRLCNRAKDRHKIMNETLKSRRLEESLKPDCIRSHDEFRMPIPVCSSSLPNGNMPYSFFSSAVNNSLYDSDIGEGGTGFCTAASDSSSLSQPKFLEDFDSSCFSLETDFSVKKINCSRFHDIFEVPQCKIDRDCEPKNKLFMDCVPGRRDVSSTIGSKSGEPGDRNCKDEDWSDEALLNGQYGKLREGMALDCIGDRKDPKTGVSSLLQNMKELWESNIKQFENCLKFLEHDRRIMQQEDTCMGKEQLKLLREISEQLSMICSQLKRPPSKKYCYEDDSVIPVMEQLLVFSSMFNQPGVDSIMFQGREITYDLLVMIPNLAHPSLECDDALFGLNLQNSWHSNRSSATSISSDVQQLSPPFTW